MKLMKLLTVGRSFKGGKSASGHYKVQQILLPKFASSVRPSKAAAAKAAARFPASADPGSVSPARVAEPELENLSAPGMDKTQKIPAGKVLKRRPEPTGVSVKAKLSAAIQKPIAALKKRLFPVRSKKKPGATATQAEWNLEKVTVARNDLSEADLEIVSSKAGEKTPTSRTTHLPDLARIRSSGREWVKMTTRLFKTSSPFEDSSTEKPTKVAVRTEEEQRELVERI